MVETNKKEIEIKNTDDSKDLVSEKVESFKKNESPKKGRKQFNRGARKPKAEFDQKIIGIRRVTRVVAGGRRFSFSVSLVIGDKKGGVGIGMGKASDTALAIEKAYNNAKKSMIKVSLEEDMSIPHLVKTKFASSEVLIKPAPGKGLIAGGSVRTVLELAGITDINAKIFSRSKNSFNNAKATIKALSLLKFQDRNLSKESK